MTKPEPFDHQQMPDQQRRATHRELRNPDEPEQEALERQIKRLKRESDEALAAYRRAFEEPPPHGNGAIPRRFP